MENVEEENSDWKIYDMETHKIFKNKYLDLKLKVIEADYSKIYLSYKGYNIIFGLEIWKFSHYIKPYNTDKKICGLGKGMDESKIYYLVKNADLQLFVELISGFIFEFGNNGVDHLIDEDCKVDW